MLKQQHRITMALPKHAVDFPINTEPHTERETERDPAIAMQWLLPILLSQISTFKRRRFKKKKRRKRREVSKI